ncbi:MAG: hypothetical protein WCG83_03285 [Candidatus Peregrinibacteria bacterium]
MVDAVEAPKQDSPPERSKAFAEALGKYFGSNPSILALLATNNECKEVPTHQPSPQRDTDEHSSET